MSRRNSLQTDSQLLAAISHHADLNIRVSSNNSAPLPPEVYQKFLQPHTKSNFFFEFIIKGKSVHSVDLHQVTASKGEMLFVLPNQIHLLKPKHKGTEYFKISFDQTCLSLLPKHFPFLINPANKQLITFDAAAQKRVTMIFKMLADLLATRSEAEVILANLHTLMTECNRAYFLQNGEAHPAAHNLSQFIQFKTIVEAELTQQPDIDSIAQRLSITTNRLYYLVKNYSGMSPKEFILRRLIVEAQRTLCYSESSVKEIAFALGFDNADYFSKLFKKKTGKTLQQFTDEIQDLSGK